MFQRFSVAAKNVKNKILIRKKKKKMFLLPVLSEGENMTNVRSDIAKK